MQDGTCEQKLPNEMQYTEGLKVLFVRTWGHCDGNTARLGHNKIIIPRMNFEFGTMVFYSSISGIVTSCPCGIWCHGLINCPFYVSPIFATSIPNCSVSSKQWVKFFSKLYRYMLLAIIYISSIYFFSFYFLPSNIFYVEFLQIRVPTLYFQFPHGRGSYSFEWIW